MSETDRLYALPRDVAPFRFDEQVVRVFPDMIRRSVPGYATIVEMTGIMAARYAQPGSTLYDLGCSLGASLMAMRHQLPHADCRLVGVDNSPAMIARARELLATAGEGAPVELRCEDLREAVVADASVIALNFTLQFVPREDRGPLLARLYAALRPGGILVLSEKVRFADAAEQALNEALHHAFKRAEGYSDLEIAQKRNALEKVLVPDTLEGHAARLRTAGFGEVTPWFRCFNFVSLFARKAP